jgi:transposase
MSKDINYFGIDISAKVFDVMDSNNKYYQFSNDTKGFKQFLKLLDKTSHCVMESTGYYHHQLAYYLLEHSIRVSVENPVSIKRFIQMNLSRIKTDKSDAKMICLYAQSRVLRVWKGNSKNQIECRQIASLLELYTKKTSAIKNKIKGEKALGNPSKIVVKSLKNNLKHLQKEIALLEDKLLEIVKLDYQELLTKLETIPGLGRKTSIILIILTNGFEKFNKASELCSFAGLTPIIRQSGSSIRGRARISKMGSRRLRNLLFMCSFSAFKHNKACKEIHQRITNKGKCKKVALIAVCNKLLKQAFAIAKSGLPYDENYRSTLLRN